MDVPALPRNEADLDEWSVYADELQSRGDPRGELIARDLALPASPGARQLAAFHELARRLCTQQKRTWIGWCLGHARTMRLVPGAAGRERHHPTPDAVLANAAAQLRQPVMSRLEALAISFAPSSRMQLWQQLFEALPASCTRLDVQLANRWDGDNPDELLALVPPTVRELGLHIDTEFVLAAGAFVSDRFAVVDLTSTGLDRAMGEVFAYALAGTHEVELRVGTLGEALALGTRARVGTPDDAGVIYDDGCERLPRWSLERLQDRYGVIGVRAQLARVVPEGYAFTVMPNVLWTDLASAGAHLVRRGARWTLEPGGGTQFWIGEREVTESEELRHGDTFALEQEASSFAPASERIACTFAARDLDAMLRSMHAGGPRR